MTVSVVIPCFNAARFVGDAVASACAQAYPNVEVIVVDDGSTDGSAAVIARHPRVRLVAQANSGLSRARNAGFAASSGDIVIFLDADDRLTPNAAHEAVKALQRSPSAGMAFGRCRLIDASGLPLPTPATPIADDFYAGFLQQNLVWTPAVAAFRRDAFAAIGGFDPTVNPSADYDLYLRMAQRHTVVAHDAMVAEYRQHPGSMSTDPVLMLRTTLAVMNRHRGVTAADPRLSAIWAEGVRRWRWFYGERLVERFRHALKRRRYPRACVDALLLLRWYPEGVRRHLIKKAMRVIEPRQRALRVLRPLRPLRGSGRPRNPGA